MVLALLLAPGVVRGDQPPPIAAIDPPAATSTGRHPVRRPNAAADRGAGVRDQGSGSWWFGTVGIVVALAACGWVSIAARRFSPRAPDAGIAVKVVGRAALSPRQSVYLLRAGDRILIVGTGPRGSPSLLGEMPLPPAAESPGTPRSAAAASSSAPAARFDYRLGDDA